MGLASSPMPLSSVQIFVILILLNALVFSVYRGKIDRSVFKGGLKAAHAALYEDAFGGTNYGFKCEDRVYTKPVIYAAAKQLCDKIPKHLHLRFPSFSFDGYRSANHYDSKLNHEASRLLNPSYYYAPIFEDGKLFDFARELPKTPERKMIKMGAGPDRLVIDKNCNLMGAFSDPDYRIDIHTARAVVCKVLNSNEDYRSPSMSSSGSLRSFRDLSREKSPEISNFS